MIDRSIPQSQRANEPKADNNTLSGEDCISHQPSKARRNKSNLMSRGMDISLYGDDSNFQNPRPNNLASSCRRSLGFRKM